MHLHGDFVGHPLPAAGAGAEAACVLVVGDGATPSRLPAGCIAVVDGAAALQAAAAVRPDVVLIPLALPAPFAAELARQLRRLHAADPPWLVALMAPADGAAALRKAEGVFDQVLALPLAEAGIAALRARLGSARPLAPRPVAAFDLAEHFTRAARQVIPVAVARGLHFSFDYRGPQLSVDGDPIALQCGLHRLLLAVVDLIAGGFVMFSAEASLQPDGAGQLMVEAGGAGPLAAATQIDAIVARLGLVDLPAGAAPRLVRQAVGLCPSTRAAVTLAIDADEGVLLRMALLFARAVDGGGAERRAAPGSRAWIVDDHEAPAGWMHRRLQRLGWEVTRFNRYAQALQRLRAEPASAPGLLVVIDAPAAPLEVAAALQCELPPTAQRIFAVRAGSERLASPDGLAGYDLRVLPLSPTELADFCLRTAPTGGPPDRAEPEPGRAMVLLVDDNEINRIVGSGLLEALGYEVRSASGGQDAIEQCRRAPPHLVLMDLDMPDMDGTEATRRLRALQRSGEVAPFPILAATAEAFEASHDACEQAGMDGFMAKPLLLDELAAQLRRYAPAARNPDDKKPKSKGRD